MTNELPKKFGSNNQYQLNQPLPKGVAAEILANTRTFLEFLENTNATTHPTVRALHHSVELQIASLVGLVEAEKFRERDAADGKSEDNDAFSAFLQERADDDMRDYLESL